MADDPNLYGYCGGNPVNFTDPTGHVAEGAFKVSFQQGWGLAGATLNAAAMLTGNEDLSTLSSVISLFVAVYDKYYKSKQTEQTTVAAKANQSIKDSVEHINNSQTSLEGENNVVDASDVEKLCYVSLKVELYAYANVNVTVVGNKEVYLTFDDGPNPETTPKILDALDKAGVKATFFVTGSNVKQNPELTFEIVARGHHIGNHTYNHKYVNGLNGAGIKAELSTTENEIKSALIQGKQKAVNNGRWNSFSESTQQYINSVIATGTHLFRPPGGNMSYKENSLITKMGYKVCMWDVDPFDWKFYNKPGSSTTNLILDRIVNGWDREIKNFGLFGIAKEHSGVKHGSIILLHDYRYDQHSPNYGTAEALPTILNRLQSLGYTFGTL